MASRIESHGNIAQLTLDEPRGNALGTKTIEQIHKLLDDVVRADPHALVLAGKERVFGAGLDLTEASAFDRRQLSVYVDQFEEMFMRLLEFPIPVVAAVRGAAYAGGAVIALACDVRVVDASAAVSLNEVELGIPFPSTALEIARFGLPPRSHTQGIAFGMLAKGADAVTHGFAHELHADPVARAREIAADIATKGKAAVRAVRRALRAEHIARAQHDAQRSRAAFVDAWMAPDAQARIAAVVAKLARK
jgi:enoyl-CoA hydratase